MRDETAQLFSRGGALHCTAGAPRPRRSTPHCATASLSAGRDTALVSHCTRASSWRSGCAAARARGTEFTPTNGRPRPWSQTHPSSKLWVLRSPRRARLSPPALHPRPLAHTPSRFRHCGTGLRLRGASPVDSRDTAAPAVAYDGAETRVRGALSRLPSGLRAKLGGSSSGLRASERPLMVSPCSHFPGAPSACASAVRIDTSKASLPRSQGIAKVIRVSCYATAHVPPYLAGNGMLGGRTRDGKDSGGNKLFSKSGTTSHCWRAPTFSLSDGFSALAGAPPSPCGPRPHALHAAARLTLQVSIGLVRTLNLSSGEKLLPIAYERLVTVCYLARPIPSSISFAPDLPDVRSLRQDWPPAPLELGPFQLQVLGSGLAQVRARLATGLAPRPARAVVTLSQILSSLTSAGVLPSDAFCRCLRSRLRFVVYGVAAAPRSSTPPFRNPNCCAGPILVASLRSASTSR
ncbi:hypothetical protein B0H14DRAFT_3520032 [Mycena olivaceomarginata]|nr:hypothetical protein B0H14DRAFT_3520032 [Mycena olivaceomarginata]